MGEIRGKGPFHCSCQCLDKSVNCTNVKWRQSRQIVFCPFQLLTERIEQIWYGSRRNKSIKQTEKPNQFIQLWRHPFFQFQTRSHSIQSLPIPIPFPFHFGLISLLCEPEKRWYSLSIRLHACGFAFQSWRYSSILILQKVLFFALSV